MEGGKPPSPTIFVILPHKNWVNNTGTHWIRHENLITQPCKGDVLDWIFERRLIKIINQSMFSTR